MASANLGDSPDSEDSFSSLEREATPSKMDQVNNLVIEETAVRGLSLKQTVGDFF